MNFSLPSCLSIAVCCILVAAQSSTHVSARLLHSQTKISDPVAASAASAIQFAARQTLLDYSVQKGLGVLGERIQTLDIPDVSKTFSVPVLHADVQLQLKNIKVLSFNTSIDDARLLIMEGFFHLQVEEVQARLGFDWHWEAGLGIQGSGDGELLLRDGRIDYVFAVSQEGAPSGSPSAPRLEVISANDVFEGVQLTIHAHSADWLYQAVLRLFKDAISKKVQAGIASAMMEDVPKAVNHVLETLPTHFALQGLPFRIDFEYSIYTLTYVLIKGYSEVDVPVTPPSSATRASATPAAATSPAAAASLPRAAALRQGGGQHAAGHKQAAEPQQQLLTESSSGSSRPGAKANRGRGGGLRVISNDAGSIDGTHGVLQEAEHSGQRAAAQQRHHRLTWRRALRALADSGGGTLSSAWRRELLESCPLEATPLPLTPADIALDPRMVTVYLHENMVNCVAWGLFRSGLLSVSIVEGTIPQLHITTDLLGALIPQLPKTYPKQPLRIDVTALAEPKVLFTAAGGVSVAAMYRTAIYVNNETLGTPHIATLDANLTFSATINWDTTVVTAVSAQHTLLPDASMAVPVGQWDMTVKWFVQNYAGLFPLRQLVETYVKSPVTSLASLINVNTATLDSWFALSGDVQVFV